MNRNAAPLNQPALMLHFPRAHNFDIAASQHFRLLTWLGSRL
jgi:hypothetical protein